MVWLWPLGPHTITSLYDMSMGIYSCSKFMSKTMNSRVAFEIPHVGTWSKTGPKWGHLGSILGVPNSVESTNTPISSSKTPVLGRKWPFVDGPPKGPISDPRVQNPDPSESYPLRAKMTLKWMIWGPRIEGPIHGLTMDTKICTRDSCLHHIVSQWNAPRFGSKMGPFWGTPLGSICVK